MSEILKQEIKLVSEFFKNQGTPSVVGVGKTGHFVTVLLETGHSGACFIDPDMIGEIKIPRNTNEIIKAIKLANGDLTAERSLGIALINAYSLWWFDKTDFWTNSNNVYLGEQYDPLNFIKPTEEDIVAQVGYIPPYIDYWLEHAGKVLVLEKNLKDDYDRRLVIVETIDELAEANILIATGASLLYHSTEKIFQACSNAKLRGIVGPSCTMLPEPLFDAGADFVGGAKPIDGPKSFLAHLLQGGPINWFQSIYEKIVIFREGLSPNNFE